MDTQIWNGFDLYHIVGLVWRFTLNSHPIFVPGGDQEQSQHRPFAATRCSSESQRRDLHHPEPCNQRLWRSTEAARQLEATLQTRDTLS